MNESTPASKCTKLNNTGCNITPIAFDNEKQCVKERKPAKRKIGLSKSTKIKKQRNIEIVDNGRLLPSSTTIESFNLNESISDLLLSDFNMVFGDTNKAEEVINGKTILNESNTSSPIKNKSKFSLEKSDSEDIFLEPDESKYMEKTTKMTDIEEEIIFDKIVVDSNVLPDETFSGISDLFNETFPLNNPADLTDNLKNKLLKNANTSITAIKKSTGFTQFHGNFNESFSFENSQFHELGPFYGLPSKAKTLIEKHKGIKDLYEWQQECLKLPAIRERKNLVYALPTSGGKTLVAEILILREVLCYKRSVLFVLPFVAIVQEKVRSISLLALELGFIVEEYAAGKGSMPPRKRRRKQTIYVCTIEKALAVVQSLIEVGRLDEIGLAVVDELHLLAEGSGRGAALETLLTYLMYTQGNIHIVGMSATIGNLNEISRFLKAETYTGDFRPVELTEFVKCGDNVYRVDWKADDPMVPIRTLSSPVPGSDPDGIGVLVNEVCPSESVLVFCPTKKNCENVATLLCKQLPRDMLNHRHAEKRSLIELLTSEFNGRVCPVLRECLRYGVAYHHSGLTADERKLLEDAYREGVLCCICCTSTLAAGVNLPAKRVILRAPYVGREFISLSKYKQMVGRAGRAGLGACGESFLICQSSDAAKVGQLLRSKMDDSVSAMTVENCKDIVLSAVGLGVAVTRATLRQLLQQTLLHIQAERRNVDIKKMTDECIAGLYKSGALRVLEELNNKGIPTAEISKLDVSVARARENQQKRTVRIGNSARLSVSRLGRAAMKGCMSLPTALKLYEDLMKAESSLVLLCSLHILYLVTPYQIADQINPNFALYFDVYMQLSQKEQHAAKVIGLTENHVSRMVMGQKPKNVPPEVINRFYITLILNELWKHQSVWEVASLFQISRGLVQNLMSSATSFSWNVLRFCEELEELWSVKAILNEFAPRLAHCCEAELLPLMELPAIKRVRARQLHNAGFKSLQSIAKAEPRDLTNAVEHLSTRNATHIIAAAKLNLLEKVENLKEEAEDVLEDLGSEYLEKRNLS